MSNQPQAPKSKPRPPHAITVRGSEAYRDWAAEFAAVQRCPVSLLVDKALAEYAKAQGFRPPPER